jgi:tetratricopeptide (TPR) repeat protein
VEKDKYEDLFSQAKSAYDDGGLEAAIGYLDNCIQKEQNFPEAYFARGILLLEIAGDSQKALKDFEKAIMLAPNDPELHFQRGMVYANLNEPDKALVDFSKIIELDASHATAYSNRASIYLRMKEPQKAVDDCAKAIELSSGDVEPYYNRGIAYANMGELAKALEDYNKVIELAPENTEAYAKRAFLHSQLGNTQDAIRDFEKFLELDPGNAKATMVQEAIRELKGDSASSSSTSSKASGGCYIATAVYGSYDAPEALCLRRFRDEVLAPSVLGRLFISLYYSFSPSIAERLKKVQHINMFVRKVLDKVVAKLNRKFHSQNTEIHYERR